MNSNFYYTVLAGFLSAGAYRYFVSQGWNIAAFLKTDWKMLLKSAFVTAVAGYFAHDVCAALSNVEAIADLNPCGTLESAPRLAGFFIGALGGTMDLLMVGRNILELIPVVGPKLIMIFSRKPVTPAQ